MYSFGSNGAGQLGLGHLDDVSTPFRHRVPSQVESDIPLRVHAGGTHTVILYESGIVTITGSIAGESSSHTAESSILASDISLCSATWTATFLCYKNGIVGAFGSGDKGELGVGKSITCTPKSGTKLKLPWSSSEGVSVVDISSGVQHTVLVLSNGDAWGWGNGRKGQLGQPPGIYWEPKKITEIGFKASRVACGREFTYLVGNPSSGMHAILGNNKWGVISEAPKHNPDWKDIGASWGSIFTLQNSGQIRCWGRNDHGQLAPPGLPPLRSIAVGSEHLLALTMNKRVLAWGWGEHGNCGPKTDSEGDVKLGWNLIQVPNVPNSHIRGIGAGCATSWIWK